jgi:hypothetical protein
VTSTTMATATVVSATATVVPATAMAAVASMAATMHRHIAMNDGPATAPAAVPAVPAPTAAPAKAATVSVTAPIPARPIPAVIPAIPPAAPDVLDVIDDSKGVSRRADRGGCGRGRVGTRGHHRTRQQSRGGAGGEKKISHGFVSLHPEPGGAHSPARCEQVSWMWPDSAKTRLNGP